MILPSWRILQMALRMGFDRAANEKLVDHLLSLKMGQ
jgi:hypothetical protein